MSAQYITVRETSQILGISEKKVMDLIEGHKLQAYRIADQFLRLKRSEVIQIRQSGEVASETADQHGYTASERWRDFFYFNDFYIIAAIVILSLLYVVFFAS